MLEKIFPFMFYGLGLHCLDSTDSQDCVDYKSPVASSLWPEMSVHTPTATRAETWASQIISTNLILTLSHATLPVVSWERGIQWFLGRYWSRSQELSVDTVSCFSLKPGTLEQSEEFQLMLIHGSIHQKKCQVLSISICIILPFYAHQIPLAMFFLVNI